MSSRLLGRPLARLYDERIIKPLGLTDTAYDPHARISGPHARCYGLAAGGKLTDATAWTFGLGAAGGIVSDADGLHEPSIEFGWAKCWTHETW